jgi:hypothetical protein
MLILKMLSQLTTALLAFAIGTGIVSGFEYVTEAWFSSSEAAIQPAEFKKSRGIYFAAPSVNKLTSSDCDLSAREIRPFGWNYDLSVSQIPAIARMARDGHWFFFETKTDGGRSFEFFGIIPDSASDLTGDAKITIPGKLVRVTNGEITGNVDANYLVPVCAFQ